MSFISREEVNALPIRRYEGEVVLIESPAQLGAAMADLGEERVAGFDTETRPAFRAGVSYPPALAQLATARAVYLFPLLRPVLDFSRELGVEWGFGTNPLTGQHTGNIFSLDNTDGANNAQFINPITTGPTALFNIAGAVLNEKLNLNLQLQAAEVNGDGKVISSPRLVTLDN